VPAFGGQREEADHNSKVKWQQSVLRELGRLAGTSPLGPGPNSHRGCAIAGPRGQEDECGKLEKGHGVRRRVEGAGQGLEREVGEGVDEAGGA